MSLPLCDNREHVSGDTLPASQTAHSSPSNSPYGLKLEDGTTVIISSCYCSGKSPREEYGRIGDIWSKNEGKEIWVMGYNGWSSCSEGFPHPVFAYTTVKKYRDRRIGWRTSIGESFKTLKSNFLHFALGPFLLLLFFYFTILIFPQFSYFSRKTCFYSFE